MCIFGLISGCIIHGKSENMETITINASNNDNSSSKDDDDDDDDDNKAAKG
jgi:hypothetical protein